MGALSPPNPLNLAAFPSWLVHLCCLQFGPRLSPTPLEAMCIVLLADTHGQMLRISSRPSYKSAWGKVYVNWLLLLWEREYTFLSLRQWTCGWCFFQKKENSLTLLWNIGTLCFNHLWLWWKASWISCAIEVEVDSTHGIHWRRLRISPTSVSNYQLTKWRD